MGIDHDRKPAQTGITIVIALLVFIICAFASAVIAAYHRDKVESLVAFLKSLDRPVPAASLQHPTSMKRDRLTRRLILSQRLAKPQVIFPNFTFSLADVFAGTDFCALLRPAFPELTLAWRPNALFSDMSDCTGELGASPVLATDEAMHNSFFIQTRRSFTGASTGLRLKLVNIPGTQEQRYDEDFERAAEIVISHIFSIDAQDMLTNIRRYKPFDLDIRGLKIKLFEEQMTPGAFNLMLEAKCGKYDCPATNPYYNLSLPSTDITQPQALTTDGAAQQE